MSDRKFSKKRSHRGIALIVVISVMMMLSIMGVTFARLSIIERAAAQNNSLAVQARLNAFAGLDRSVALLRSRLKSFATFNSTDNTDYGFWIFKNNTINSNNNGDNSGAGIDLALANNIDLGCTPSYPARVGDPNTGALDTRGKHYLSGIVEFTEFTYTLKILDTSAQINLNDEDSTRLQDMLQVMLEEEFGTTSGTFDTWENVAINILATRNAFPSQRFTTKDQLVGAGMLTATEFDRVRDYVTVHGWQSPHTWQPNPGTYSPNKANYVDSAAVDQVDFSMRQRSPVNINTAPRPVLVAVLANIGGFFRDAVPSAPTVLGQPMYILTKSSTQIDTNQARSIADAIIAQRFTQPFTDWIQFHQFVDGLTGINTQQKSLLKANANPNALINRWIPNKERYVDVDKSDLSPGTTEFTFGPMGFFEINSRGRVYGPQNRVVAEALATAVVQIAQPTQHTSQRDFHANSPTFSNVETLPETAFHRQGSSFGGSGTEAALNGSPFEGYIQLKNQVVTAPGSSIYKAAYDVDNNFSSLWDAQAQGGGTATRLTLEKRPRNSGDVRSVFKGEARTPEGFLSFNFGSDETEPPAVNGQMLSFDVEDLVSSPSTWAKEGSISIWLKFDKIEQGSDESILYVVQKLEDTPRDSGVVLKVVRYGDEIFVTRFIWENPVPVQDFRAAIFFGTDQPQFLWTRLKLAGLSNSRSSRKWYRLVVGWEDYTQVYAALSKDGGQGDQQSFSETLLNDVPNDPNSPPGNINVIRIGWVSGSIVAGNGNTIGADYVAFGGYSFTPVIPGVMYLQPEPTFAVGVKSSRFSNSVIARVEGYDQNLAKNSSDFTDFFETPYNLGGSYANEMTVNCGCNQTTCPFNRQVEVVCAAYTMWNSDVAIAADVEGQQIDNSAGGVLAPVVVACGDTVDYSIDLQVPIDGGETSPIFDDITIYSCSGYPIFEELQFD